NNLHDPNQSGFKAAHSTETALLAVSEKLHAARSAKLSSVLIFLDLSAAFDTVNHKTLLSTLKSLGICGTPWEWFASYLEGRSYQPLILTSGDKNGCIFIYLSDHGAHGIFGFPHSTLYAHDLNNTVTGAGQPQDASGWGEKEKQWRGISVAAVHDINSTS
ncbi:hypothetical protein HF521_020967, partial [Silurus meridionalis]